MNKLRGYSLIEVLISISLLIMTITLFSRDQLQIQQKEKNLLYENLAAQQLSWLMQVLQPAAIPAQDLVLLWQQQIQAMLPNGHGKLEYIDRQAQLSVTWGNDSYCSKEEKTNKNCLSYAI